MTQWIRDNTRLGGSGGIATTRSSKLYLGFTKETEIVKNFGVCKYKQKE